MSDPFNTALGGMTQQGDPAAVSSTSTPDSQATQTDQAPAWMAQLSKDLQADEGLRGFKKIDELAQSYKKASGEKAELEKKLAEVTPVPSKDAPKEVWDKFFSTLGKPETPDKYEFKREGDLASVKDNPDFDKSFKQLSHELNLTTDQANALYNRLGNQGLAMQKALAERTKQEAESCKQELQKQWGRDYDTKIAETLKTAKTFFGESDWAKVEASGLGNSPTFMARLAGISKVISEDKFVTGANAVAKEEMSAGDLIFTKSAKR